MKTEGYNPYDSAPEEKRDTEDVVGEEFIPGKDYLKEATGKEGSQEDGVAETEWVDGNQRRSEQSIKREERYRDAA